MSENCSSSNVKTAFSELSVHFSKDKMTTQEFLEASTNAVSLIKRFGKVFAPVTNDMSNNIIKLTQKYEQDPEGNKYIEDMILQEQSQGEDRATDALLWLRRALLFLSQFYQCIVDDSAASKPLNDLAPFLKKAYSVALEPYHGWLGTQLFNVLSRFVPTRSQLLVTLALDTHNQEEIVVKHMQNYNETLTACVHRLTHFYNEFGLETPVV